MSKRKSKSKAREIQESTGMTLNEEHGLRIIMSTPECREWLAFFMTQLEFMEVPSEAETIVLQGIALGLIGTMTTIQKDLAVSFVAEFFMIPGGEQDGRGSSGTDGDDGNGEPG